MPSMRLRWEPHDIDRPAVAKNVGSPTRSRTSRTPPGSGANHGERVAGDAGGADPPARVQRGISAGIGDPAVSALSR